MSIKHVCVDYGRVIQLETSATRVEGRSTFEPIPQQWFQCRLTINESGRGSTMPRSQAAMDFRARLQMAQLMTITTDLDSNLLVFRSDQLLDVSSLQLGRSIWRNEEEPQPIRKKRRVIGFTMMLERVIEREYEDLLNQNTPHPDLNTVQPGAPGCPPFQYQP